MVAQGQVSVQPMEHTQGWCMRTLTLAFARDDSRQAWHDSSANRLKKKIGTPEGAPYG